MNDNVAPFLIPQTHTIRQAMEQLEKTEEKIVFVVDEESRLIGSLRMATYDVGSCPTGTSRRRCFTSVIANPMSLKRV